MATVEKGPIARKRVFIGKAWNNKVPADAEENAGVEYVTVKLDRNVRVNLEGNDRLVLWPAAKRTEVNERTGQPFVDADYNVSVSVETDEETEPGA